MILLAFTLGAPRRVLAVCAPLAAAVVTTSSAFTALGTVLTIFHLVGPLLVGAVGSNYALFFGRALSGGTNEPHCRSLSRMRPQ